MDNSSKLSLFKCGCSSENKSVGFIDIFLRSTQDARSGHSNDTAAKSKYCCKFFGYSSSGSGMYGVTGYGPCASGFECPW